MLHAGQVGDGDGRRERQRPAQGVEEPDRADAGVPGQDAQRAGDEAARRSAIGPSGWAPYQPRRWAAIVSGSARRVAISASATTVPTTTAIACACTACRAMTRRVGLARRLPLMRRWPAGGGGRGLALPVERVRVGRPLAVPDSRAPAMSRAPAAGPSRSRSSCAARSRFGCPSRRVADQRGAPLEQLHEAGQRLVGGGQPGRPVRRGGERGPQPVLGRADRPPGRPAWPSARRGLQGAASVAAERPRPRAAGLPGTAPGQQHDRGRARRGQPPAREPGGDRAVAPGEATGST